MKCLHCRTTFHDVFEDHSMAADKGGRKWIRRRHCPECDRFILSILFGGQVASGRCANFDKEIFVYPRGSGRPPVPIEVKEESPQIADDYHEACLVLPDSPKASAALGRRCLQHLLQEKAGVKKGSLNSEISEIIDSNSLPTHLADSVDAIRVIGNFAAHPMKGQSSGEIVPVEPGEAEWTLDVLEGLFDFFFVQPTLLSKKRERMNQKLAEAGKPPLK